MDCIIVSDFVYGVIENIIKNFEVIKKYKLKILGRTMQFSVWLLLKFKGFINYPK